MENENEKLRTDILNGTIQVFNRKGLKFTMDDVALELGKSKKTIYTIFPDKETMFLEMVDFCFDSIKESEAEVLEDKNLDLVEKIRKIMGVLPDSYKEVDFRQLYTLKDKYPKIYKKVEQRLENGWDATIGLIKLAVKEGKIRPVNIVVIKTMLEATLEQFFQRDVLVQGKISYNEALKEVVDIIIDGIIVR